MNNIRQMASQITPVKRISHNELRKVDSEEALIPITYQQQLEARLKQNTRIINMIHSNRIERQRSRRKQEIGMQENQEKTSSKKILLDQIVTKLDEALKQSKTSLHSSKRCHSETKQISQKIKAFQNSLKQVKQSNIETQLKINQIKNEMASPKVVVATYQTNIPTRLPYSFNRQFRPGYVPARPQAKYDVKGHYVYPKYVRPETRYRSKYEEAKSVESRLTQKSRQ